MLHLCSEFESERIFVNDVNVKYNPKLGDGYMGLRLQTMTMWSHDMMAVA